MKTKKRFLTVFVMSCLIIFSASIAHSAVRYVPGEYSTIQGAIDEASYGDTIIVSTGAYEEAVSLTDGLTLVGLGLPTVDSRSTANFSAANDCIIDGFRIHMLLISGKSNVTVRNCVLLGGDDLLTSATIFGATDVLFERNTFSDEYYGGITGDRISVINSQVLTFRGNIISTKNIAESTANVTALSLETVSDCSITNNLIKAECHELGTGVGIKLSAMTGINLMRNNIISGTTYSIDGDSTSATISYNDLPEGVHHVGSNISLGPNNFSAEPVFTRGKGLYPEPSSPCVDAGIKLTEFPEDTKPDIGAYRNVTFLADGESLQDAIDVATPNETIYLSPGTYDAEAYIIKDAAGSADVTSYGILVIAKDIHIVGSGRDSTFVIGPVEFIFSDGSLENLTVKSPNALETDHIADVDYDLDGRQDCTFAGSLLIANGSPVIENVMLEPDFVVLGTAEQPTGTGIAIIENTSGSPTAPIIRNTTLKNFVDAIRIDGYHDEMVLSPVVEHSVFDQNTNGVNCDTPYALIALRNNIFSNMANAIDLAKTPYVDIVIDNIQNNLFYANTKNCVYDGSDINILVNSRNNQEGDPQYLSPDNNVYVTLFDSVAMDINAGLEHYSETQENGDINYYESANKFYLLANETFSGIPTDFARIIPHYDESFTYLGRTVEYYDLTMEELLYYEVYDAAGALQNTYYADGTFYPDGEPGGTLPNIILTSPNGAELLKGVVAVMWTADDPDGDPLTIDLYYSTNAGTNFDPLVLGLKNDGIYGWISADYPDSADYKIRVVVYKTNEIGTSAQDESDAVFKVDNTLPAISITSPADNTGVDIATVTVKIDASDANLDTVEVKVSGDPVWQLATFVTNHYEADIDIPTDGTRAIIVASATDTAGNISTDKIGIIKGYMLFVELPKYYSTEENQYNLSGIAAAQDILDLMRPEANGMPTDSEIYNHAHPLNWSENASLNELDPRGMQAALCKFDIYDGDINSTDDFGDSYLGYNFDIHADDNTPEGFTQYLKETVHWIAYPVTKSYWWNYQDESDLVEEPNCPGATPIYGTYDRWVVINGLACSQYPFASEPHARYDGPWNITSFTVYGLWLTDPATRGIGQDIYLASSQLDDYLRPMDTTDRYAEKYVMVAEPPEEELELECKIAPPKVNKSTLNLINIAEYVNDEDTETLNKHLVDIALVVTLEESEAVVSFSTDANLLTLFKPEIGQEDTSKISWKDIIDSALLLKEDFRAAIQDSVARQFIKVERIDTGEDYYIVPFDKFVNGQFLSYAAIIVDAKDGHFMQASFVKEPTRYIQITKEEAIAAIVESNPSAETKNIEARLVWELGGMTLSPFYPYWEVSVGKSKYYVAEK